MGEFDQWVDTIQKLLDDPTATDEQYLQLEQAFTDHMNQTDNKAAKGIKEVTPML